MKICIFSRSFHPAIGGLEGMASILATEFQRAGHRVEVVTDTVSNEKDATPYVVTRASSFWVRMAAFRRADVALFMNLSLHGLPPAWLAGTPVVASHQSCYPTVGPRRFVLENAKRFLMRFVANIACSHYVAQQVKPDANVIPNAFKSTCSEDGPAKERRRDFVFCGRLVSDKGADLCLHAFHAVRQVFPDATLTIIGDGPERTGLEALARELGLTGAVQFTGWLSGDDLAVSLREHACMVVPSLWEEPFGIVALEGIACCDTVIVTRRGGLPEAVGRCGVVVGASKKELTTAMESVVSARRRGRLLPGQPLPEQRKEHLALHSPRRIADQYLVVLAAAKDRGLRAASIS